MKLQEVIEKIGDENNSLILHKLPQETLKLVLNSDELKDFQNKIIILNDTNLHLMNTGLCKTGFLEKNNIIGIYSLFLSPGMIDKEKLLDFESKEPIISTSYPMFSNFSSMRKIVLTVNTELLQDTQFFSDTKELIHEELDKVLNNIKEHEIPSAHQIFIRGILF